MEKGQKCSVGRTDKSMEYGQKCRVRTKEWGTDKSGLQMKDWGIDRMGYW